MKREIKKEFQDWALFHRKESGHFRFWFIGNAVKCIHCHAKLVKPIMEKI